MERGGSPPRIHSPPKKAQPNPSLTSRVSDSGISANKSQVWTPLEETQLLQLIEMCGSQKWTLIAQHLPNRDGKHCRERWHNHLNPKNKKCEWSKIEEWVLLLLYRKKKS